MSDVIKGSGDPVSWQVMLKHFDDTNPVVENSDPLDHLHVYLWNVGIQDTTVFIERCVGRMLASFDVRGPDASRTMGRDLASLFFSAKRRANWTAVGQVLTSDDIVPDARASEYTSILTGQAPKLEHLQKGFFHDRPQIFHSLWSAFTRWLSDMDTSDLDPIKKTSVFWISGRSGEGKSVLLLQLIAEVLRSSLSVPLVHLKSGDDLPRLLETTLDGSVPSDPTFSRIYAAIDDLYDLKDRDRWDEDIRNACALRTPPLAVITCGPTEQLEQFSSRLSDQFELLSFEVPKLEMDECRAFLAWYQARTGYVRDMNTFTTENPLLVQFMFELAQGVKLSDFARRFKERLIRLNLFEAARAILAVNALYMDAPLDLLRTHESRDALERLCEEDQLHFRLTPADAVSKVIGVRLAHPHLAWLLFVEWVEPPTTVAKAWARELAKALEVLERDPNALAAGNVLYQILNTTHLSNANELNLLPSTANRQELVREIYRLHVSQHGNLPTPITLPRWLDLEYKIPGLQLGPDPVSCAVAYLADSSSAPSLHGSVAAWIWLISESRPKLEAERLREAAKEFLDRFPDNPGAGFAVERILNHSRNDVAIKLFVASWLAANLTHPQAYHVIAVLVKANPTDVDVREKASDWLAANLSHPELYWLLATLVAANPGDSTIMKQASDWLAANLTHPQAYHVIAVLVKANPTDVDVREKASNWLASNPVHPQAYHVIAALVAANPAGVEVREQAGNWLAANPAHPQAYHVIAVLVKANPTDVDVREKASDWLASNPAHPQAYQLIAPLVKANPTDVDVREKASNWLVANLSHPKLYWLLATLVAANPGDSTIMKQASDWLAANPAHPQAYQLIAPLVKANPTDVDVREKASNWLASNETHTQYHCLLKVMITRTNSNEDWLHRGEVYLKKPGCRHPETILAVLLTGGKAAPRFVEIALDYTSGSAPRRHRDFILNQLARALVHNFENAVEYLNGSYDARRKSAVCHSIVFGMKRYPDIICTFLRDTANQLHPTYLFYILKNTVDFGLESNEIDASVAGWLINNFRRRGYRAMLQALQRNPNQWTRLEGSGDLSQAIVDDFSALPQTS